MSAYRLTVRIESLHGPVPALHELRRHLLDVVAETLPDATATRLTVHVDPTRRSAQVQLDVQTATLITADEVSLIESGTLSLLPSPLSPLTLEFLGPDVTVTAEPLEAA